MKMESGIGRIIVMMALTAVTAAALIVSCDRHGDLKGASNSKKIIYHCPMHPNYMSPRPGTCPICIMDLVPVDADPGASETFAAGSDSTRHFVKIDPSIVQNMGVRTEMAGFRALKRDIRTSAIVTADERRTNIVTTKVMGYIEKLYANYTGFRVNKGDPLFDLYSPDLVSGQTEYLSALASRNQSGAEQLSASARQRLLNWDISPEQIEQLEKSGTARKTMTFFSPVDGIIVDKMVTEGQSVEPGMTLFKIIDFSHVWVIGSIYQQDIPLVNLHQKAEVTLDYFPGKTFTGTIVYIAPELDEASRTLQVRVDLANTSDLSIKPGMNATVVIQSVLSGSTVTIPDQAIIHSGLRTVAIVSRGNGLFEPREINIGQSAEEGYTQVKKGLREGEVIVVSSQFLIDAESNMKAAVMSMTAAQVPVVPTGDTGSALRAAARTTGMAKSGQTDDPTHSSKSPRLNTVHYTCPMDPEIISDHPGICPKCKMNLVKKE
jgi:Cu(I)/Ag(I) efflux system membrane fusion protein